MFIYLIKTKDNQQYKIGIAHNVYKRLRELQTGNPEELILINSYNSKFASKIETSLHNHYNYLNKRGEWFYFDICIELKFLDLCKQIEENILFLKINGNNFV